MEAVQMLREAIGKSPLGIREVARRARIDPSNLRRFAAGKCGITLGAGLDLAMVLGVDLHQRDRRKDPREPVYVDPPCRAGGEPPDVREKERLEEIVQIREESKE